MNIYCQFYMHKLREFHFNYNDVQFKNIYIYVATSLFLIYFRIHFLGSKDEGLNLDGFSENT